MINDKVAAIEQALSGQKFSNPSLLAGEISVAIFYSSLYKVTRNATFKLKCDQITDNVIEYMGGTLPDNDFCNGLTGVAWGLSYLANDNVIDIDRNYFFREIDDVIYESSISALDQGSYDYLFGGLGGVLYALERRPGKKAGNYLGKVADCLDKIKENDAFGIKWRDTLSEIEPGYEGLPLYTLGLAHGVPGVIAILLRIYSAGIKRRTCEKLICGSVQWLLSHSNKSGGLSVYSNCINGDTVNLADSRLAWCYGDLGIALVVFDAAAMLGNEQWRNAAVSMMERSINRRDPLDNIHLDAMVCHGTAGISHLFRKFYDRTGDQRYLGEAQYWLDKTIALAIHEGAPARYKKYNSFDKTWLPDYGILNGIAGIGLTILSHSHQSLDWDKCLLLS